MSKNIFISLAKYADRQEENFLKESFVYLINMILERDHELAINIMQMLFGADHDLPKAHFIPFSWRATGVSN